MTWDRQTTGKLGLLATLYLSQGLPFGFFTQALPVLMRKQGYSLEAIGLATLLALPWALKFLWSPYVDRHGRRRTWILPLQFITVGALLLVAAMPESAGLRLLLTAVFFINLLSATQDIATDGLAVDILSPAERGLANGVQVAGYRFGMIAGGGVLLILHESIGWAGTFMGMAVIIALASIPVFLHREKPKVETKNLAQPSVISFFKRPGALAIVCLIVCYKFGDAFATGMLRPFLADAGLSLADIGWLLGTVGFIAGLLGALAGGALVNPLGRKRSLIIFGVLQAVTVGGYALVAASPGGYLALYLLCGAEHFAGGMATAALFTCMMDWCRPGANATDYTVQASLVVVATGLASTLSGFSAGSLGYVAHFALATFLATLSIIVAAFLFPKPRSSKMDQAKEVPQCA